MASAHAKSHPDNLKKPQLKSLELLLAHKLPLDHDDLQVIMKAVKDWLANSGFGQSVRVLHDSVNAAREEDKEFLSDLFCDAGVEIPASRIIESLELIDNVMSESQLDSLYAELNKAEQQRNALLDIQGDYPDVKVPKALTTRINELSTTLREMKAKYPDFDYQAIVG